MLGAAVARWFLVEDAGHALLTCIRAHVPAYRLFGFRVAEGTAIRYYPAFEEDVACLHGTPARIPKARRARLERLADEWRHRDGTCRCPAWPECEVSFCSFRARTALAEADPS